MARFARAFGIAVAIVAFGAPGAHAHPLGNFTVNRYAALEISPRAVVVRYAIDVAEVPTFQEFATIDADHDNAASVSELAAYARAKAAFLSEGVRLQIDGAPAPVKVVDSSAALHRGEGGLQTLRLDATFSASLPFATATIEYADMNFGSLPGWREVIAAGVDGEAIVASDVPASSVSDALRAYPKQSVARPLAVTTARVRVAPGHDTAATAAHPIASARLPGSGAFAALIERDLTVTSTAVALLLALMFGALHAFGPGHGKTVMAAYLVGADGKLRDAIGLGVAVSVMHTASVIALGSVTLWLSSLFPPAAIYPWLSLVSGIVILGLGARLLLTRVRARAHAHDHSHDAAPLSRRGLAAIAASGGLLPSPAAVVVLLGAIALHRIAFGLVLVAAFSVGLAAALSAVGMVVLRARSFATSRWRLGHRSLLPSLSSAALLLAGCFLTVRAALTLAA